MINYMVKKFPIKDFLVFTVNKTFFHDFGRQKVHIIQKCVIYSASYGNKCWELHTFVNVGNKTVIKCL